MRSTCVLATALLAASTAHAEPLTRRGRGVSYLDGGGAGPLAGVGSRSASACTRVAFDVEFSKATWDPAAHRLLIENSHAYAGKHTIGDVVLMATGTTRTGSKLALAVHLRIDKSGERFQVDLHPHALPGTPLEGAEVEPWEVVLGDGKKQEVVYTRDKGQKALLERSLVSRLLSVELSPLAAAGTAGAGSPLDLSVRMLGKQLLRLELLPAPGASPSSVAQLLQSGSFSLRITPRTHLLPRKDIARDVFLYGLEAAPAIADLARTGFKKGEPLMLSASAGKGQLTFRGRTSEMKDVVEATRAFLEFNSLGIALRIKADERLAALNAPAPAPAPAPAKAK